MQSPEISGSQASNSDPSGPKVAGQFFAHQDLEEQRGLIYRFLVAATVSSLICWLLLVVIPADPINAWLFGYSRGRLAIMAVIGLVGLGYAVLVYRFRQRPISVQTLTSFLSLNLNLEGVASVFLLLTGIIRFGRVCFLVSSLNSPGFWQHPAQVRLAPFMVWLALLSLQSGAVLQALGARIWISIRMRGGRGLLQLFSLVSLAIIVTSAALYFSNPELENAFIDEDQLVENLTAALFCWTGLVSVLAYRRKPRPPRTFIIIPVVSFWAFIEELSFGERIFDLEMPYLGGEKFDGLHDLFFLIYESLRARGALPWTLLVILALFMGIFIGFSGFRKALNHTFQQIMIQPHLLFFSIGSGIIAASFILDLEFLDYRIGYFLEELLEFLGAFALSLSAVSWGWLPSTPEPK